MNKHLFLEQALALVEDESNIIANLSNLSAFLKETIQDINWVGFYFIEGSELVLGPFQGKVACTRIPLGQGVCGTAALTQQILRIKDVHQFVGHITCDSQSNSEIVLPIIINYEVIGVLDIDSPLFNRFLIKEEEYLKGIVDIIENVVFKKENH